MGLAVLIGGRLSAGGDLFNPPHPWTVIRPTIWHFSFFYLLGDPMSHCIVNESCLRASLKQHNMSLSQSPQQTETPRLGTLLLPQPAGDILKILVNKKKEILFSRRKARSKSKAKTIVGLHRNLYHIMIVLLNFRISLHSNTQNQWRAL